MATYRRIPCPQCWDPDTGKSTGLSPLYPIYCKHCSGRAYKEVLVSEQET